MNTNLKTINYSQKRLMPSYPFDRCFLIKSSIDVPKKKLIEPITKTLELKHEVRVMKDPADLSDVTGYDHIIKAPSSMSRSDMVVLIAHAEIWQEIVYKDYDSALILEDTTTTILDSSSLNTRLLEFYSVYSDSFDILYLGKCQDSCKHYTKAYNGVYKSQSPLCKYAYIITRSCAKKLLEALPSSVPTDIHLNQLINDGLRAYVFHPNIIKRNDIDMNFDSNDPVKAQVWKESVYRENVECKYENEDESKDWTVTAAIAVAAIVIVVLLILYSRR